MDRAEAVSGHSDVKHAVLTESATTTMKDIKAFIKTGIINSNLMMVFAGFWLAVHFTGKSFSGNWNTFIWTMLGSGLVIAGGCILNNWYDVDIDPVMERTKRRPTVTGRISLPTALILGISTTILGIAILLLASAAAALLAFCGWFAYVVLYTIWTKRRYTLNTAVGSLSGAVPPLIGWAAIETRPHIVIVVLFLIMFVWQTPHFLALAMKKNEDYKAAGIPMLPAVYGFAFTKRQIVIYIACLLPMPFYMADLGTVFVAFATLLNLGWLGAGIAGFMMKDDLKWANIIFVYSLNYLMVLFIAMIIACI